MQQKPVTRNPLEHENPYILLVDDSSLVSERLAGMLYEAGIFLPLAQAHDYEQAVSIMATQTPRIAVLDINLPGKSGFDLLRTIKALQGDIVVVMFSNQAGENYRTTAQRLGADYFLDKSNDFEYLPALLHHIVYP